ncbi:hypothetical protein IMCC21906_00163 [Spongiibacter sp. IMCC21906]|uniref:hypothetical protein n=1 Tax=Spongiibacter sp. IMCC21906 TaxID=1620392 RepID=UPI00062DDF0C|nr:hypothetical protein [Spongiibacter sp. IMCC21906]AKH67857.1 hypothetical protein IMCC21906_00163 [Spongiibacter sp. IMCC21906]
MNIGAIALLGSTSCSYLDWIPDRKKRVRNDNGLLFSSQLPHFPSFPRKRESSNDIKPIALHSATGSYFDWIPDRKKRVRNDGDIKCFSKTELAAQARNDDYAERFNEIGAAGHVRNDSDLVFSSQLPHFPSFPRKRESRNDIRAIALHSATGSYFDWIPDRKKRVRNDGDIKCFSETELAAQVWNDGDVERFSEIGTSGHVRNDSDLAFSSQLPHFPSFPRKRESRNDIKSIALHSTTGSYLDWIPDRKKRVRNDGDIKCFSETELAAQVWNDGDIKCFSNTELAAQARNDGDIEHHNETGLATRCVRYNNDAEHFSKVTAQ